MKMLNCPKCGGMPEKWIRYEARKSVIVHCPSCGYSTKLWRYEDIEYCAVSEAVKDWNKTVKKYEGKKNE